MNGRDPDIRVLVWGYYFTRASSVLVLISVIIAWLSWLTREDTRVFAMTYQNEITLLGSKPITPDIIERVNTHVQKENRVPADE